MLKAKSEELRRFGPVSLAEGITGTGTKEDGVDQQGKGVTGVKRPFSVANLSAGRDVALNFDMLE